MLCREKNADGTGRGAVASSGVLYWLRQDFRLHDNPALCAAAAAAKRAGGRLTLVYVCSLEEDGDAPETGALLHSSTRHSSSIVTIHSSGRCSVLGAEVPTKVDLKAVPCTSLDQHVFGLSHILLSLHKVDVEYLLKEPLESDGIVHHHAIY